MPPAQMRFPLLQGYAPDGKGTDAADQELDHAGGHLAHGREERLGRAGLNTNRQGRKLLGRQLHHVHSRIAVGVVDFIQHAAVGRAGNQLEADDGPVGRGGLDNGGGVPRLYRFRVRTRSLPWFSAW